MFRNFLVATWRNLKANPGANRPISFHSSQAKKGREYSKSTGIAYFSNNNTSLQRFRKVVILGNAIAIPMLFFGANEWLNDFAFRIDFNWGIPLVSING